MLLGERLIWTVRCVAPMVSSARRGFVLQYLVCARIQGSCCHCQFATGRAGWMLFQKHQVLSTICRCCPRGWLCLQCIQYYENTFSGIHHSLEGATREQVCISLRRFYGTLCKIKNRILRSWHFLQGHVVLLTYNYLVLLPP